MSHLPLPRVFALLALFILTLCLFNPTESSAQAYLGQLTFLENFAIKLYERGDIAQAEKEFQRILKIHPESAIAQKYLEQIKKGAAPQPVASRTPLDKANSISSDIESLKKDVVGYQRDLDMLESLIRNHSTTTRSATHATANTTLEVT